MPSTRIRKCFGAAFMLFLPRCEIMLDSCHLRADFFFFSGNTREAEDQKTLSRRIFHSFEVRRQLVQPFGPQFHRRKPGLMSKERWIDLPYSLNINECSSGNTIHKMNLS